MQQVTAAAFGLFGREEALKQLGDVLTHGGSALVTGEPGTGKSSLLHVADQLAQRAGRRVLSVHPTQFDRGLPFAGLAELVAQCPDGTDRVLPAPQRRALAVALRLAEPDGEIDALAVPLALRGLLAHLCEDESVTLIIDDVQWLDQASAGSLGFALRVGSVGLGRLSVLVGTRPDPGAGADLVRELPEPRRDILLQALEDWAIGRLLRSRLGARWTPPRSAGVARASAGNPFLALMVAQAMQSDLSKWRWSAQDGHDPVFPVPPSLAEILGEKVSLLPDDARDVLLYVSAAGRLTVPQLEAILGAAQVRSALEAAADWDVATVGASSVVSFTHPMLASAVYDVAAPTERRRAHRTLAEKLDDPVERARHRARTLTGPDEVTADELQHAAEVSRRRGALHLTGELFESAAVASPPDAGTAVQLGRWLRAVDAYIDEGDAEAANTALATALTLDLAPGQQAQVLLRQIRLSLGVSDYFLIAEQAVRQAPPISEVRAEALFALAEAHRQAGHGRLAWRLIRLAGQECVAVERMDLQLAAMTEQVAIERIWGLGAPDDSLQELGRLNDAYTWDLSTADYAWTSAWLKGFFARWDDPSSESQVREGIAGLIEAGRYGDLSDLYIALILVLIRASRVRDAQTALEEADRLGGWTHSGQQERMARVLATGYAGGLEEARRVAHEAVAASRAMGSAYWTSGFLAQVGFIETSARSWAAALNALRELADIFVATKMVDLEQLLWGVDYADAALQVGALDEVKAAIDVLRRQGGAGRTEANVAADRCEALLTAARGNVDSALHELVRIVDLSGAECPFEHGRSRLALGQVYRRAGYKGLATQNLNEAAAAFESLGIPRWADRARDEAARTGLHTSPTILTETERRIAELVGSGHSNQETAAALFISVKTVEANLTRIYRKLEVRTRTELANRLLSVEPDASEATDLDGPMTDR